MAHANACTEQSNVRLHGERRGWHHRMHDGSEVVGPRSSEVVCPRSCNDGNHALELIHRFVMGDHPLEIQLEVDGRSCMVASLARISQSNT